MDRPFTLSEGVDSWNTIIFIPVSVEGGQYQS